MTLNNSEVIAEGRVSLILRALRCMKTICAKQAKMQFAYFVQRDQHGIIATRLTQRKVLF